MKFGRIFLFLLIGIALVTCKQVRRITDVVTDPTARELYRRNFEEDSQGFKNWQRAFEQALLDSLTIELPYAERGIRDSWQNRTVGYRFLLEEGSLLYVQAETDTISQPVFLDLLKIHSDSLTTSDVIKSNDPATKNLEYQVGTTGKYLLVVQPTIGFTGSIDLILYTSPSFGFPVAGKDYSAIRSFWGAERDGGARSHEGVDIFAPRGTPVVAVKEGRITFTGNRGLGGKQVWLRESLFGKSVYYAHLDSILVQGGSRVKRGDTLGLVGNSGNARTTAPHLHFGVYASGRGAVNPLPFIKRTDSISINSITQPKDARAVVSGSVANLRQSPTSKGLKIGSVQRNDTLNILGHTQNWGHVRLQNGQRAYIHRSLLKPL
ncbi:M23 family metallopeptidase [Maribacter cobaltidurans]|uniref:Uncharacterized protein n=1 Tax=Maribacter cobaltidurans TaxID=1178778 RepID=A0A223V952_9FLAO|nr:M23 family metallopeptidase [Maribacter cobaltidurans]ASV31777.1 hypothetical protein CJ263_17010 [Maribacter cobaltidurans]GGD93118.1 hypothetical protein GCM10011412_33800 [Maribacter cobaltidurans]